MSTENFSDERKQIAWEHCRQTGEAIGKTKGEIREDIDVLHKHGVRGKEAGVALQEHYHPERHQPTRVNVQGILSYG